MTFRKDINGLRAIAVIGVVIFHINPGLLPGGFAGVDVFFAISGYLMTSIIFSGFKSKTFTLKKFYLARAKRILPALTVLVATVLSLGWFILNPLDYADLGKHASSSVTFLSNFAYWQESGYFDADAHTKWLLHTWSLSAEWQFYLLYPLLLLLLKKVVHENRIKHYLAIITGLLFALSATTSHLWPEASYYLLHTRAWEMLAGGLVFLYPLSLSANQSRLISSLGLLLILISFGAANEQIPWPGSFALLPITGVLLVIAANQTGKCWLNSPLLQKLGLWSYSIYLWHWVLVVWMHHEQVNDSFLFQTLVAGASIAIGAASYNLIEKKLPTFAWMALLIIVVPAGAYISKERPDTFSYHLPEELLASMARNTYECFDKPFQHKEAKVTCPLTPGTTKVLALGDSHMYAALPALEKLGLEHGIAVEYVGYSGCPPLLGVYPERKDQTKKDCFALNVATKALTSQHQYSGVFLASRWTYFTEGDYEGKKNKLLYTDPAAERSKEASKAALRKGIQDTLAYYNSNHTPVWILLQVPMQLRDADEIYFESMDNQGNISDQMLEQASISRAKHMDFQKEVNQWIIEEATKYESITVIDPAEVLCEETHCPVGTSNTAYYFDRDHLSVNGAMRLLPLLENKMQL